MPPPRKRSPGRPAVQNLTVRPKGGRVYYGWRDPRTGREHSLEATDDATLATTRARQLNELVARELADRRVREIIAGKTPGQTLADFRDRYLEVFGLRNPSPNTIRSRKSALQAWIVHLGDTPLHRLETSQVAELLRQRVKAGQGRMAQALRSALIDVLTVAHEEGLVPAATPNVARLTRQPKAVVRRARLTLEQWQALDALAADRRRFEPWVGHALRLALVTGQRREDLAAARFRRGRDWDRLFQEWQEARRNGERVEPGRHPYPVVEDGALHVVQGKTGALVRIPLTLRLEVVGLSVGDVIKQCRDRVASPYLLHHATPSTLAQPGDPVHIDTLSRSFARLRQAAGWTDTSPPTFHEIRSLAARLYSEQGTDPQALLGHKEARMTAVYQDLRGAAWVNVGENHD
jgi:hypothetical protein